MSISIPSERNFAIYHRSLTDGCPRTQVAAEFQISTTRVQQIVQQVQVWICRHGSREFAGLSGPLLHLAAMRVSLERLARTRQSVRQQWETLRQQEVIVRTAGAQRECTVRPAYRSLTVLREFARLSFDELKVTRELAAYEAKLVQDGTLPPSEIDWEELELVEDEPAVDEPPGPMATSVAAGNEDEHLSSADFSQLDPTALYQKLQQLGPMPFEPVAARESAHSPVGACMKSEAAQDAIDFEAILQSHANDSAEETYEAMQLRKPPPKRRRQH